MHACGSERAIKATTIRANETTSVLRPYHIHHFETAQYCRVWYSLPDMSVSVRPETVLQRNFHREVIERDE